MDFLIEKGANLSACTKEGWTPLHSASRWGHHQVVGRLLAAGANVNAQSTGKQAPLHVASVNREARKTVQLLLAHPGRILLFVNKLLIMLVVCEPFQGFYEGLRFADCAAF